MLRQPNESSARHGFIFSGGLLIFLSPYLIHEAAIKNLPWSLPIIAIPIYAGLSYGAFKLFWPHIIGKAGATTQEKDEPNRRNQDQISVRTLTKSKRFRRIIGLQSYCIPQTESLKPDCVCPPEKSARKLACGIRRALSPVLFEGKTCRIAAIFNDSCSNAALFLCTQTVWRRDRDSNLTSPFVSG